MTLDRLVVPLARLVQRQIQPPEPIFVAPEPRLRGSVQQREARRILELVLRSSTEVFDDLGVVAGCGEPLSLLDYD